MRKLFLVLLAVPCAANAALIDIGGATLDTDTGLEWLDVTLTTGASVDDLNAGFGGYFADGWQHATTDLLCGLFSALGDAISNCSSGATNAVDSISAANADLFVQLLGQNRFSADFKGTYGFFNFGGASLDIGVACINRDSASNCIGGGGPDSVSRQLMSRPLGERNFVIGHFLVRATSTSVPEPGTLALLGAGLVGTGFARRRKKT